MAEMKAFFALVGAFCGWFFGGLDSFLYLLIIFVVVDYITGVLSATISCEVSSSRGVKGIMKKMLIFLLVGMGNALDMALVGGTSPIRTAVIFFYLSNEGISILENITKIGLPVPQSLRRALGKLKEDEEDELN